MKDHAAPHIPGGEGPERAPRVYDGEEQDAYILGVSQPVGQFTGKIIAIVRRADDVEEKWVVCPPDQTFTKQEIAELIRFQEQYFQSEIIMEV